MPATINGKQTTFWLDRFSLKVHTIIRIQSCTLKVGRRLRYVIYYSKQHAIEWNISLEWNANYNAIAVKLPSDNRPILLFPSFSETDKVLWSALIEIDWAAQGNGPRRMKIHPTPDEWKLPTLHQSNKMLSVLRWLSGTNGVQSHMTWLLLTDNNEKTKNRKMEAAGIECRHISIELTTAAIPIGSVSGLLIRSFRTEFTFLLKANGQQQMESNC